MASESIKKQRKARVKAKAKAEAAPDALSLTDLLDMPDIDFINKSDADKLMQLLYVRAGSNDLFRHADKMQATSAITAMFALQASYKILQSSQMIIGSVEDLQKIIASINRAIASVNACFKALGIDGSSREEEVTINDLSEMLLSINLESSQPPIIQKEYLRMTDDIIRTEDGSLPSEEVEIREALEIVKKPINVYNENVEKKISSSKVLKPEESDEPIRTI
jgi:hypothetical protein